MLHLTNGRMNTRWSELVYLSVYISISINEKKIFAVNFKNAWYKLVYGNSQRNVA